MNSDRRHAQTVAGAELSNSRELGRDLRVLGDDLPKAIAGHGLLLLGSC